MMAPPFNSSVQSQIDSLGDRVAQGFDEIKGILHPVEDRLRAIERMEAGCQPVMITRIDAVISQLSDHEIRLKAKSQQINLLEQQMKTMVDMYKNIIRFAWTIGMAFLLAIGGFLFSLITHQVMVVFK